MSLAVAGCDTIRGAGDDIGSIVSFGGSEDTGSGKVESRYLGAIVADDPQAVDLARRALGAGARAADAAVVIAMTLSVTQPGRAGLDGGGVCLVKGEGNAPVEELDFLPQTIAGSALPVSGLARGMAALQARFGRMRWQQALGPVEHLAFTGITITPQLIADLNAAGLEAGGPNGLPLQSGQILPQQGVASTMSRVRVGGPNELYTGGIASVFVGAGVPGEALATYVPNWHRPASVEAGNGGRLYFADAGGGPLGVAAWQALAAANPGEADAFAIARQAGGGEAAGQAAGTTGFLVADARGEVVTCTIGMGRIFGSGHLIESLGIYSASPFDGAVLASLSPVLGVNAEGDQVTAALAGGQGGAASADSAAVAFLTLMGRQPLGTALGEPRSATDAGGNPGPERVNALICRDGFPKAAGSCALERDPRGYGFALQADNLIR